MSSKAFPAGFWGQRIHFLGSSVRAASCSLLRIETEKGPRVPQGSQLRMMKGSEIYIHSSPELASHSSHSCKCTSFWTRLGGMHGSLPPSSRGQHRGGLGFWSLSRVRVQLPTCAFRGLVVGPGSTVCSWHLITGIAGHASFLPIWLWA